MALAEQIQDDLKTAMKAKDSLKLAVLRMLKSEIRNKEIEIGAALDDDGITAIVRSMIKKRKESADAYSDGGREELAAQEKQEAELLGQYLPPALSDDTIQAVIDEVLAETPAERRQFGPVMGMVMKKLQGQADGGRVNALLKAALAE